jgi:GT2 family glycosyltransferase
VALTLRAFALLLFYASYLKALGDRDNDSSLPSSKYMHPVALNVEQPLGSNPERRIASNLSTSSISVVIASKGRPGVLSETIESLLSQNFKPNQIVVVVPAIEDLPPKRWGDEVRYIVGPHGLTLQRNKGIEAIPNTVDYLGFFDDDVELRADYLAQAVTFLSANPSIIAISGRMLAIGRISREQSKKLIADFKPEPEPRGMFFSKGQHHILHGCNMVIRRAILNYERFDENLPFYSYGEDYDLSIRLERYGLIGRFSGCVGVHLESPGGRVREVLRGYSFVANNWYFLKKGVMHLPFVMAWARFWFIVARSLLFSLKNLATGDRSLDWRGRLQGHLAALKDISLGRCHPRRITEI